MQRGDWNRQDGRDGGGEVADVWWRRGGRRAGGCDAINSVLQERICWAYGDVIGGGQLSVKAMILGVLISTCTCKKVFF